MRNRIKTIILFLCFIIFIAGGCKNGITDQDFEPTPEDIEEAEIMAICLSGEISAPQKLKEQLLDDLSYIRNDVGDDFEAIDSIRFFPPWVPGCVLLGLNDSAAQKIISGEYDAWDTLNEEYPVAEIDTNFIPGFSTAVIYFEDILNPRRLSELYEQLPGVRFAEPNFYMHSLRTLPDVYPRIEGDGITYLFRDYVSLFDSEYWYFGSSNGQPVFIGYWNVLEDTTEPDWWSEAEQNREQYSGF
jgi:hypothetical protein